MSSFFHLPSVVVLGVGGAVVVVATVLTSVLNRLTICLAFSMERTEFSLHKSLSQQVIRH